MHADLENRVFFLTVFLITLWFDDYSLIVENDDDVAVHEM
jgi:hypothetical protein